MKNLLPRRVGILVALCATIAVVVAWSSCGENEFNLYKPIAQESALKSKRARLEEARVLMDDKKYDEAAETLTKLIEEEDSNEARLLYAAAQLGIAQLDIWSIIKSVLDNNSSEKKSGSTLHLQGSGNEEGGGMDELFNTLSDSVLGTGEERETRMQALSDALATLMAAPDRTDGRVQNTACIFGGILAVPIVADAKSALEATVTALEQIRDAAESSGTECPNISLLDESSAKLAASASTFSLILAAAGSCPFLNLGQTADVMNQVETRLATLQAAADKGCDGLPTCPAALPGCQALFPACVQEALSVGTSSAKAQDGSIASCELILHCTVPTACFG